MRTEEDFRAADHLILEEFEHEGNKYVYYKLSHYSPIVYITGSRFEWVFGLVYSKKEEIVIEPYYLTDSERREIKQHYPLDA